VAEGFSQTLDYIASRWKPWTMVAIVVVAGGCILVWYFCRTAQQVVRQSNPYHSV
jgi:hypothetical protein